MGHVRIHRLLLCAIIIASVSEHPRLRTAVFCAPHGYCCSEDSDESKFDNFELQALIAGQPFVFGSVEFSCFLPVAATNFCFDSTQRNVLQLRGPPRFWVG